MEANITWLIRVKMIFTEVKGFSSLVDSVSVNPDVTKFEITLHRMNKPVVNYAATIKETASEDNFDFEIFRDGKSIYKKTILLIDGDVIDAISGTVGSRVHEVTDPTLASQCGD